MKVLKYVVLICIAVAAYHFWRKRHPPGSDAASPAPAEASRSGFVELSPTNNAPLGIVLILAPANCPTNEARRADELQELLTNEGIPSQRIEELTFSFQGGEDVELMNTVMTGKMPVVFVNGRAKNDPQLSDIVAEYNERRVP